MQKNDVALRIQDAKPMMTPVERMVANYVSQRLPSILTMPIKQVAQESGTSEASVLRFCKTIGYRGYRDFVLSLSAALGPAETHLQPNTADQYTDICPGDSLNTIIDNVSYNNRRSIEDTLAVLDRGEVERAVTLLREAKHISFYGVGASGLVCADAVQKFLRIRKSCQAFVDGHSLQTDAVLLEQGDVAVLVSNSGDTIELLDALELLRGSGVRTIAITRYAKSPLSQGCDVVLRILTPETTFRSGAMGSRIAMLNVVDILFSSVASAEYEHIKIYLEKTHIALSARHKLKETY